MSAKFDFIIVGGGTAGCRLASRLANASTKPSVLLIEGGGEPVGDTILSPYDRYTPAFTRPDLDYGYSTTPQTELNNRVIPYLRGKGLGGSSILNFQIYLYGSKEDYNRWAELVDDETWDWEHTREIFKKIENYHSSASQHYVEYANPKSQDHGQEGTVDICLPDILEKGTDVFINAAADFGYPRNLDLNSGNPVGVGVFPSSYYEGKRTTSATAHLTNKPKNLVVLTDSPVVRVIFEGKNAVGVELQNGQKVLSSKEVILTAGSFDSPKLLLLSGVGPKSQLEAHNIDVVHELPGIGKNLQDHPIVFMNFEVDSALSEKYAFESDAVAMQQARDLWGKDKSGPLSHHNGTVFGAFLKLPVLEASEEYKTLDSNVREYMEKPEVPAFEMAYSAPMVPPGHQLQPGGAYLSAVVFLMNPQSRGQLNLSSSDAKAHPLVDFGYLTSAFDKRAMLEAIKESMRFFETSSLAKYFKGYIHAPKSSSDSDIEDYIKAQAGPVWHANGTVMMGKRDDPDACVDPSFRVSGVSNLRVADLSICPLTANNHPQSTAYLIGEKAALSIIEYWDL